LVLFSSAIALHWLFVLQLQYRLNATRYSIERMGMVLRKATGTERSCTDCGKAFYQ